MNEPVTLEGPFTLNEPEVLIEPEAIVLPEMNRATVGFADIAVFITRSEGSVVVLLIKEDEIPATVREPVILERPVTLNEPEVLIEPEAIVLPEINKATVGVQILLCLLHEVQGQKLYCLQMKMKYLLLLTSLLNLKDQLHLMSQKHELNLI